MTNTSPIFGKTGKVIAETFTVSDGVTPKTIMTSSEFGTKLTSIGVTSDYVSGFFMELYYNNGASDYLLGTVPVAALAGTSGYQTTNILDVSYLTFLDAMGHAFIPDGSSVKINPDRTIDTGYTVNVIAFGVDY